MGGYVSKYVDINYYYPTASASQKSLKSEKNDLDDLNNQNNLTISWDMYINIKQKIHDLERTIEQLSHEKLSNHVITPNNMIVHTDQHNDVIDKKNIEYLVFSGGGIKGICYVGALKKLEELNITNIKSYGGTSAGSLLASLCAIGYTPNELNDVMRGIDFTKFFDHNYGVLGEIVDFYESYGICKGDYLYDLVGDLIEKKIGNKDYTLSQLYNDYGITLVIVGTNINKRQSIYFYHNNPIQAYRDIPIRLAIRLSSSIPFIYETKVLNGDYFWDGGVLDNFPLHIFDGEYPGDPNARLHLLPPNPRVLGLNIISKDELATAEDKVDVKIEDIKDMALSLVDLVLAENDRRLMTPNYWKRSIIIPTPNFKIGQFSISKDMEDELYQDGYKRTEEFFKT